MQIPHPPPGTKEISPPPKPKQQHKLPEAVLEQTSLSRAMWLCSLVLGMHCPQGHTHSGPWPWSLESKKTDGGDTHQQVLIPDPSETPPGLGVPSPATLGRMPSYVIPPVCFL